MKRKIIYRNNDKVYLTVDKNGSTSMFNVSHYARIKKNPSNFEYTIDYFNHKMFDNIVKRYHESPWLNVKKFKYKTHLCEVTSLTFVYDCGYVLKLNYKSNGQKYYRYVDNINSLKYLKLLKLKDIEVIE